MDPLDPKHLLEKADVVFGSLKCAAKLNVASGFVIENMEDASCGYYYAHEKSTLLERYEFVATKQDLTNTMDLQSNTDIIESCTRERAN